MCPKVGGTAWEIDGIPSKFQSGPTMICGMDHFMSKTKEKIIGFTSTFERSFAKQYPTTIKEKPAYMKELISEAIGNVQSLFLNVTSLSREIKTDSQNIL